MREGRAGCAGCRRQKEQKNENQSTKITPLHVHAYFMTSDDIKLSPAFQVAAESMVAMTGNPPKGIAIPDRLTGFCLAERIEFRHTSLSNGQLEIFELMSVPDARHPESVPWRSRYVLSETRLGTAAAISTINSGSNAAPFWNKGNVFLAMCTYAYGRISERYAMGLGARTFDPHTAETVASPRPPHFEKTFERMLDALTGFSADASALKANDRLPNWQLLYPGEYECYIPDDLERGTYRIPAAPYAKLVPVTHRIQMVTMLRFVTKRLLAYSVAHPESARTQTRHLSKLPPFVIRCESDMTENFGSTRPEDIEFLTWIFNKAAPLNGGSRFFHTRPPRMTQIDAPKIQV